MSNAEFWSDPQTTDDEGKPCFRPRRTYFYIGVICTAAFVLMGTVSVIVALLNIDGSFKRPVLGACFFGMFWGAFSMLGLWIIASYFREKLFLNKNTIVQHGTIWKKSVQNRDVNTIRWSRLPRGGSIAVLSPDHKIKIYLDNFTSDERSRIVQHIRETFPSELQDGWDDYAQSEKRIRNFDPQKARQDKFTLVLALLSFAVFFIYVWYLGKGQKYLVVGILNACMAIWYALTAKNQKCQQVTEKDESLPNAD